MFLTAMCIGITLLSGLIFGAPLIGLIRRQRLTESDWLLAPFVGYAALIVVVQNLVYLDVPGSQSMPWLWAASVLLWAMMFIGIGPREAFVEFPLGIFLVSALVFATNGIGLLLCGVEDYFARAASDQFNYCAMAQFLIDVPFSTNEAMIGQQAYMVDALKFKEDRIGLTLLQGFLAASLGVDARLFFEPVILLGPTLLVPILFSLTRNLNWDRRYSLAAAAAGGMLPGVTLLHLTCFFSHAVSIPFLLACVAALHELVVGDFFRRLVPTALIMAGTISIYTEITPIIAGLGMLYLLIALLTRNVGIVRALAILLLVSGLVLILNYLYLPYMGRIMARIQGTANYLAHITNLKGLGALWLNDYWAMKPSLARYLSIGLGLLFTLLAVLGLGRLSLQALRAVVRPALPSTTPTASVPLLGTLLAYCMLPVAVYLYDSQRKYQMVKLCFSVGPVLVLAVFALFSDRIGATSAHSHEKLARRRVNLHLLIPSLLLATCAIGTTTLGIISTRHGPQLHSGQHLLHPPAECEARRKLQELKGQKLILAAGGGAGFNGWFSYVARQNDIWLINPTVNDGHKVAHRPDLNEPGWLPGYFQLVRLDQLPGEAYLFAGKREGVQVTFGGDCQQVWANEVYELWKLGPGSYWIQPTRESKRSRDCLIRYTSTPTPASTDLHARSPEESKR